MRADTPYDLDAADARVAEIGQILAAGLVRLHSRKSSRNIDTDAESSLDFMVGQSGHALSEPEENARDR